MIPKYGVLKLFLNWGSKLFQKKWIISTNFEQNANLQKKMRKKRKKYNKNELKVWTLLIAMVSFIVSKYFLWALLLGIFIEFQFQWDGSNWHQLTTWITVMVLALSQNQSLSFLWKVLFIKFCVQYVVKSPLIQRIGYCFAGTEYIGEINRG